MVRVVKDKKPPDQLLNEIALATSLREGAEGVAQIIRRIYSEGPINLKKLATSSKLPLPVVAAVRKELERRHLASREPTGIGLTQRGIEFVEKQLKVTTKFDPSWQSSPEHKEKVPAKFQSALAELDSYFQARPSVDVTMDQTSALPESSIRRALYMYESGALEGKNVILIGDDDLVSLAIALVGRAMDRPKLCERLVVVELDQRILDHIASVSRTHDFQIECISHDLRHQLPASLLNQFDTAETDPPYTLSGLNLFLSRGVSALKAGIGNQVFLSFGSKSPEEMLRVQQSLGNMGLVVNELMGSFNQYEGASILGGTSQFIHLLSTKSTRPLIANDLYEAPIYTGDVAPTRRRYRCTSCKELVVVGQGQQIKTIEELKDAGCPNCGNKNLRYEGRDKGGESKRVLDEGTIRPMTLADIPAVVDYEVEIARTSFPEDPLTDVELHTNKLRKSLEKDPSGMYVFDFNGQIIGWLWITINAHSLDIDTYGNLRSLGTHPQWRRHGIGRILFEFGIEYCQQKGVSRMVTKVHAQNEPMKNLCRELGFAMKHITMERRFTS